MPSSGTTTGTKVPLVELASSTCWPQSLSRTPELELELAPRWVGAVTRARTTLTAPSSVCSSST